MGPDRRAELWTALRAQRDDRPAAARSRRSRRRWPSRRTARPSPSASAPPPWDCSQPRPYNDGNRSPSNPTGAVITALAWSPTAPELAVGGYSGLVQLWRTDGTPRLARSLTGLQPVLGQPEAIQAACILSRRPTHRRERHHETLSLDLAGILAQQRSSLIAGDLAHEQRQTDRAPRDLGTGTGTLRSARILS